MVHLIDKELLSEVLEIEVIEVKDKTTGALYVPDNSIGFAWEEEIAGLINIHELAHKCKEWAREKGFFIVPIFQCKLDGHIDVAITDDEDFRNKFNELWSGNGKTESEAIFKACEWIRKQERAN